VFQDIGFYLFCITMASIVYLLTFFSYVFKYFNSDFLIKFYHHFFFSILSFIKELNT
jgi:hypothetical protein